MVDCDEMVDPMVCAEDEDGPGTVPGYTAQLVTLPALVLALGQLLHGRTDTWRRIAAVWPTYTTRSDAHLQQMITQLRRSVQVIEVQDAVAVRHGRTRLTTVLWMAAWGVS